MLVTSHPVAPDADAKRWLESIGSDPLYQRLCSDQKSFRARLTPKPWRCKLKQSDVRFPFAAPKDEQRMATWLATYRQKSGGFAVCEYVETAGPEAVDATIRPVLDVHDARTLVNSGLPLA